MKEIQSYERILDLYVRLRSGKTIYTAEELERYKISERTWRRDIGALRSHFSNCAAEGKGDIELVNDSQKHGYYLEYKGRRLLSYKDIFVIMKILLGSKGLAKEEMVALLEKLLWLCEGQEEYKELEDLVSNEKLNYRGPNHGKELQEKIWTIAEAVHQRYLLEICYSRLKAPNEVKRIVKPIGILFSEHYFYLIAYIKWEEEREKEQSPTIYRIDRISSATIQDEHFRMDNSWKFDEYLYREKTPLMFGGEIKNLKFWYSGPSLEAIQDKIPTVKILENRDGRYLLSAQVLGEGAEMWLRGQGEYVELLCQ